ncbi:hypothetical protein [Chryseobacterium populi]|uniref:Uncharacterized protein n=1 Tax=Chryseobacterium populi TaxID=1144316 RepID=J3CCI5_9FLAO|nr:hypothetical protein [Chryseobacterium populi]EJL68706.1 hypothetical protein PMI13_03532 [Chryseobacterium populi]
MITRRNRSKPAPADPPVPEEAAEEATAEEIVPEVLDETVLPFIISHEDEIINYIKEKATKETMKSLAPLLAKLEEAVKQQQAAQPAVTAANSGVMNYADQLKSMQEISREKIKAKELKVAERINKLQARIAGMNK